MKRIFGALILIVILAVPAVFGPPLALFIIALIVLPICLFELYRVVLDGRSWLLGWIGLVGSFPYLYTIYMDWFTAAFFVVCITSLTMMAAGTYLFEKGRATAMQVSLAVSGFIYPLVLTAFWISVRNSTDGRFWMILGLLCTFLADTGAYYVGKNFGRHPLAPVLSPKKTVEGLFGGITGGVIGAVLFYYSYVQFSPVSLSCPVWIIPLIGGAISILDLLGDLSISMFKRQFMVKDMGNLIPGHGGMLDRMDGIIPVGALLYFAIQVIQ